MKTELPASPAESASLPSQFRVFIGAAIFLVLLMIGLARAADTDPAAPPLSAIDEKKTATELPTKRKLPTARVVEVNPRESDRAIEARLNRIAATQDVFKRIRVESKEGVVTVHGDVEEESYARSFTALTEKVSGVIGVIDRIHVLSTKKTGLRLAQAEIRDLAQKFFKFIPYLITCFVILALTLIFGYGLYRAWLYGLQRRFPRKPFLAKKFAKFFTIPVYLLGFYLILQVGGLGGLAATLVGGTGMLGIIIGLAGKNIIENLLSSFMLTLRNPFKVGDQVIIGTESGVVHRVDSRCTMLLNHDGVLVQIPNATVLAAVIRNISAHPLNRVSFSLTLDRSREFPRFAEFFDRTIADNRETIGPEPKPEWVVTEIAGANVKVECTFWVDTEKNNLGRTKSNLLASLVFYLDERRVDELEDPKEKARAVEVLSERKRGLLRSIRSHDGDDSERAVIQRRTREIREPDGEGAAPPRSNERTADRGDRRNA